MIRVLNSYFRREVGKFWIFLLNDIERDQANVGCREKG